MKSAVVWAVCAVGALQAGQEKPLDPANMDTSVKPWDDFYEYANGGWLKANPIPPEYSSWGAFTELVERNNAILHGILEKAAADRDAPAGSLTQKVGDFYASGMDEKAIDAAGIKPLAPEFARIDAMKSREDLARLLAGMGRDGTGGVFYFGAGPDAQDSGRTIAQIWQGGLGLPERNYYLDDDEASKELRAQYVEHIGKMFRLLGDAPEKADARAATVLAFETKLARASMPIELTRDPEATYHKMPLAKVQELTPDFPWNGYFEALKIPTPAEIDVAQPKFLQAAGGLFADEPLDVWQTVLRWQLIANTAPYLSKPFVDETFDFGGRILSGAEELRPRWKRVMSTVEDGIGEALGELYVEENFPPEAKKEALILVENLRDALREKLRALPWMSEGTKKAALEKLEAMRVKIGYPDQWRDYSGLEIDRGPYVRNVLRSSAFETDRQLAKIGEPVDRGEWFMTPPTVNAYYDPAMNEIVFPAGILQPPFFDPKADEAVNYGGIGSVIGHEMTHGFDDSGRKYDAQGNLRNWWTAEDRENFEERAQAIVEQFDAYPVEDGLHVNGKLTTGENIADLGGVKIAEAALNKALAGRPEPEKIDGLDWRQRFFLSFAQVWRTNTRPETERLRAKTDPHSPPEYRVNGVVANLPEFDAAFGAPKKSGERVEIW